MRSIRKKLQNNEVCIGSWIQIPSADIAEMMDILLEDLNPALQDYFQITKEDQEEFAQRAMRKMKNKDILDFNVKNGRAAKRKLGPTERIMSPMKILKEHDKDTRIMEFVAAAALVYWEELQGNGSEPVLTKSPIETFCDINGLSVDDAMVKRVEKYYELIKANRHNICMKELVYSVE